MRVTLLVAAIGLAVTSSASAAPQDTPKPRPAPDNPCEVLTIEQVAVASGLTIVSARRVPGRGEEVQAQRAGAAPPPGNVCSYETRSGRISIGMVRPPAATAATYWQTREWHAQMFPKAAQSVPGLGLDAWLQVSGFLRVLFREDLQFVIEEWPAGADKSSDVVVVGVARAIARRLEPGTTTTPAR